VVQPQGYVEIHLLIWTEAIETTRIQELGGTSILRVAEQGKIRLLRESLNTLAAAQALNPHGAADVPPPGGEIFSVPPGSVS
jgi:hypothetical protein